MLYQAQLSTIRRELAKLKEAFEAGQPIPELLAAAKTLLEENSKVPEPDEEETPPQPEVIPFHVILNYSHKIFRFV